LLISADTLSREHIIEGFKQVATPEKHLPPGVIAYRLAYEDYLTSVVQAVRYTRLYLAMDPILDEDALIGLMGAYGVQASALDHELPQIRKMHLPRRRISHSAVKRLYESASF
jgi:hypothetical protein